METLYKSLKYLPNDSKYESPTNPLHNSQKDTSNRTPFSNIETLHCPELEDPSDPNNH